VAHAGERFYYYALITTGEAHPPEPVAWSEESLLRVAGHSEEEARLLRWSYADSPYYGFMRDEFAHVRALFDLRPAMMADGGAVDCEYWDTEFSLRLSAMEYAMSKLDGEGFFGEGDARMDMVINVEVMPPDYTNVLRALRLNPIGALNRWLDEAAELDD
tara:strand:- start:4137 stop:4616 length:480 start_codon:yes stop_codon:yes gene_type:complete